MTNGTKKKVLGMVEKAVSEKGRKKAKQGPIGCLVFFHQPVRPHKERSGK